MYTCFESVVQPVRPPLQKDVFSKHLCASSHIYALMYLCIPVPSLSYSQVRSPGDPRAAANSARPPAAFRLHSKGNGLIDCPSRCPCSWSPGQLIVFWAAGPGSRPYLGLGSQVPWRGNIMLGGLSKFSATNDPLIIRLSCNVATKYFRNSAQLILLIITGIIPNRW